MRRFGPAAVVLLLGLRPAVRPVPVQRPVTEALPVVSCAPLAAADVPPDRCTVHGTGPERAVVGTVLAPDRLFERGAVRIAADGNLTCVGCGCAGGGEATVIDCGDALVTPALVNAHDHLPFDQAAPRPPVDRYDNRNQWHRGRSGREAIDAAVGEPANAAMAWGELRHVFAGAASVVGAGGVRGLIRNLDQRDLQEGLGGPPVFAPTFPLRDLDGALPEKPCDYRPDAVPHAFALRAGAFLPHLGEGVDDAARDEIACTIGGPGAHRDWLGPHTAWVQAVAATPGQLALLVREGGGIVWSPRSNLALYGYTVDVGTVHALGGRIALGTDWTLTGSQSLSRELACALEYDQRHLGGRLGTRTLYRMVTEDAAAIVGRPGELGRLVAGAMGDVAVWRAPGPEDGAPWDVVVQARPQDLRLLLRGGRVLLGEVDAVDALEPASCEEVDVCGARRRVCAERDTGRTLEELAAALRAGSGEPYPLFSCGTPPGEPACAPGREGRFSGMAQPGDRDGDGLGDDVDLCPDRFWPLFPADRDAQPDVDGDGIGDGCDPDL